jgi:hypothetical protein
MATKHEVVYLEAGGTAYEIVPAPGGNGKDVTIQNNNGTANLYIGDKDVSTSSYGFVIKPNAAISFELDAVDAIFAASNENSVYAWVLSINLEKVRNG